MNQDNHFSHYAILFVGLLFFIGFLMLFRFNRGIQAGIGAFGAVFYVAWGIIHHAFEKRLSREIITEYLLFGFLAFLMLALSLSV